MKTLSDQRGDITIILSQEDFDRAIAEMTQEEFTVAWTQLGTLVRIRAKRVRELWDKQFREANQ